MSDDVDSFLFNASTGGLHKSQSHMGFALTDYHMGLLQDSLDDKRVGAGCMQECPKRHLLPPGARKQVGCFASSGCGCCKFLDRIRMKRKNR